MLKKILNTAKQASEKPRVMLLETVFLFFLILIFSENRVV